MPPRSKTSPEAILKVATKLAEADGLRGVGMRAIAAELGISPGTIYNVLGDIDDIILMLNAQTLQRLQKVLLGEILVGREAMLNVFAVADAYVTFVLDNARTWSVIIEHSLSDKGLPDWYQDELDKTIGLVDRVLKPIITDKRERRRSVAALWASLQGLASLAASGKLSMVDQDDPHDLARLLISRFFGLEQSREISRAQRETVNRVTEKTARASSMRRTK